MLKVKEAANFYGVTTARLKQIVNDEKLIIHRENNGYIKIPAETMSTLNEMRGISFNRQKISIAAQKGGIGKSILTLFTATYCARYGIKTLIIDCDPELCSSLYLAKSDVDLTTVKSLYDSFTENQPLANYIQPSRFEYVDFIPSSPKVRRLEKMIGNKNPKHLFRSLFDGLEDAYDAIFFDLPPSFNTICSSAYLTSDLVIMPVCPDIFSLESLYLTLEDIHEACQDFECNMPKIKVLKNKFSDDRKAAESVNIELNREFADSLLEFQIKDSAQISNALNEGVGIFDVRGNSSLKQSFHNLGNYLFGLKGEI